DDAGDRLRSRRVDRNLILAEGLVGGEVEYGVEAISGTIEDARRFIVGMLARVGTADFQGVRSAGHREDVAPLEAVLDELVRTPAHLVAGDPGDGDTRNVGTRIEQLAPGSDPG